MWGAGILWRRLPFWFCMQAPLRVGCGWWKPWMLLAWTGFAVLTACTVQPVKPNLPAFIKLGYNS